METFKLQLAGRELSIETGRIAQLADASVFVRYGDTVVLVTVCASAKPKEGIDFFPLSVDYEERMYSVGKIPGGFIKREGRATEKAILSGRLVDRPIRPLFPDGYRNDVQVVATIMSVDEDNVPELLAMIGSSAALSISAIPFNGPTGSVAVGLINGEFILNPTNDQRKKSDLHLIVSGTKDAVMMVEAGAKEVQEDVMLEAIMFAHDNIKKIVAFIEEMAAKIGQAKKEVKIYKIEDEISNAVREYATAKVLEALRTVEKLERQEKIDAVNDEVMAHFAEIFPDKAKDVDEVLYDILKEQVRKLITIEGIRPDDRALDEIRPISCETGVLPRVHGSGLFTRGQTQVMTIVTLGTMRDVQILDGLSNEDETKRYIHHYNFPPYSVGETKFMRGPGRREIGHGALAERALEPMIPSEEEFPYAIRLVSEVVSSNGSTSQASVCGSTLALLDAGVPIKAPVAGVAMGLIKEGEHVAILTDIQGMEDFLGDMDFKVAGTDKGITAIQMDIKIAGIDRAILERALEQARKGRLFILDKMNALISKPRKEMSKYAPKIISFKINPDKIRDVIGQGGKVINKIIAETGVKIDIEDDGRVFIAAVNQVDGDKALRMIEGLTKEVVEGEIYLGKVMRIMNFGAFVEILPGKEGLVHISKLDSKRVEKVEDVVSIGDEILVKVTEIDKQGRINLSRKDAMMDSDSKDVEKA